MKITTIFLLIIFWLLQSCQNQGVTFSGHFLYQSPSSRVFSVSAGDLDMDSYQDILFTEPDGNLLQWFRNENNGLFSLKEIGAFNAIGAIAVDFDADQDMDVLACSYDSNQVVFFENDGNQVFTMHVISSPIQHPLTLASADIDADGDLDIVCATQDAGTGMVLLRNDGNLNFTYIQLSTQSYSSTWSAIIDLDKDNDLDILGNNFMAAGGLLWYEQTAPMTFLEHLIPYPWAHGGAAGDLDGDGDIDLAAAACGSSISWFENDGNNIFTRYPLTAGLNCPVSVEIADIDNDGFNDVVGEAWGSNKISWWKNAGNHSFILNLICDTLTGASGLCVADMNNDSIPDVIAGSYSKKLVWFENDVTGTGLVFTKDRLDVDIHQNLITGDIIIQFGNNGSGRYEVELLDAIGQICFSAVSETSGIEIHTEQFQQGIYLLRVLSSGKQYITKLYTP